MPEHRRRWAKTDATQQRILNSATRVFRERGYSAATIGEVVTASGASTGSIYHHFGGKEGIAAALYLRALTDYQAGFLAALRARRGPRAGIEAVVRHDIEWIEAHPAAARLLLADREAQAAAGGSAELRAANRAFFAAVQAWLAPHVADGAIRRLDPDLFEALVLGPSHEYARHRLAGRATTPLAAAGRVLAAAAWSAVSP